MNRNWTIIFPKACTDYVFLSYGAILEEGAKGGRYNLKMEGKGGGEKGAFGQVGKTEGAWV